MSAASDVPIDPYAELPELYDLEHAEFADDVELYLQLAEVIGDPILELGCGTGRILAPLARAGWRVTGLDRSGPMLDRARRLVDMPGLIDKVALLEGSMDEADDAPGGPFGLVIISLNGIMHLTTQAEQRAVLSAARRALDPRGMLVIDTQNVTPEWVVTLDGRVHHDGTWRQPNGDVITRFSARTHAATEQRIDTELWYDVVSPNGQMRRVRTAFPMRYLLRSEVELLLELAGFAEWQIYGSYELDPHEDSSDRLIVTAEATPS